MQDFLGDLLRSLNRPERHGFLADETVFAEAHPMAQVRVHVFGTESLFDEAHGVDGQDS